MAVWPNNYSTASGMSPYRRAGYAHLYAYNGLAGNRLNQFTRDGVPVTSSVPAGYGTRAGYREPLVTGEVSTAAADHLTLTVSAADLLKGGPMAGESPITLSISGDTSNLSMIVALAAAAALSIVDGSPDLKLTVGMGSGFVGITITDGSPLLALLVPMASTAGTLTLSASSDLRGTASLEADITPYTELSPESLAASVWSALAANFNDPGTMGEKMNDAGTAGDPWATALPGAYGAGTAGERLGNVAADVTDAVWDETALDHNAAGSMGEKMNAPQVFAWRRIA